MNLFMAIITLFASAAALVTGLSYLFFLYELGNESPAEGGWSRVRPGQVVASLLLSFLNQLFVMLLFPLGFLTSWTFPRKYLGAGQGPAFLLVHGLYHNSSAWLPFSLRLKRRGMNRVSAYTYFSFGADFQRLLDRLDREVDKSLEAAGGEPLVLVGHSLGGLLIRAYVSSGRGQGKVRLAVTMGAPHQGSRLAALALGRLGRSLIHQGPLIREIKAADSAPGIPCLSLCTDTDNFVLPNSALKIHAPGWREEQVPAQSHVCHLFLRPSFDKAVQFVDEMLS